MGLLGLLYLTVLFPLSGWITSKWVGSAQSPGQMVYLVLTIQALLNLWLLTSIVIMAGLQRSSEFARIYFMAGLLTPIISTILVSRLGIEGAAAGSMFTVLLIATAMNWRLRQVLKENGPT